MSVRFTRTFWCMAATLTVLLFALPGCSLFGGGTQPTPTVEVPPTETPLAALPTFTAVPTLEQLPTFTATPASETGWTVEPTLTPTTASQPPVGGDEPAATRSPARVVQVVVTRVPTVGDVIENGSFEEAFQDQGIAAGWGGFNNEGAVYAWVDELQPIHVTHGSHAQLMRIMGPGQSDRYVGIYQTVDVVAGETYTLTMHGLVRSSTAGHDDTPYGHRMQWAIDYQGGTNWYEVQEWTDPGWNDVPLDEDDVTMSPYVLQIEAQTDKLTLYIRGWTKWPILGSEAKFYVDGVSLQGPVPGEEQEVEVAVSGSGDGSTEGMPTTGATAIWLPIAGVVVIAGFAVWEIRKMKARN